MAKLYTPKTAYSIIFAFSAPNSNDTIEWIKYRLSFPPSISPPTFEDIHNSFEALDTKDSSEVMDALDLTKLVTSIDTGQTDTRYQDLALTSDVLYYIK